MKHNIPLNIVPFAASTDVPAHLALTMAAGGVKPAAPGDAVIGYSGQYDVPARKAVDVVTGGLIPVTFSTAVTQGALVATDVGGKLKVTTDAALAVGVAAEDCAADEVGSIFRI